MISERIQNELNAQLNRESFSAYLYLAMAAYFEAQNLPGFANWMHIQVQEETLHAQKFYTFINDRRGRVVLEAIGKPKIEWESPLQAFEESLAHEQHITSSINNLVTIAMEERDYATKIFLDWFVTEQVEEELSVSNVIEKLKILKDVPGGIYIMDSELAQRTFSPPAEPAAA